jgi:hypothetical protein
MVCTGSVKALLSYQSISGLRPKQQAVLIFQEGGLSFQWWRSPVKIGLVAHGISGVQNCVKYSAREKGPKVPDIPKCSKCLKPEVPEVRSGRSPEDPKWISVVQIQEPRIIGSLAPEDFLGENKV